MDYHNLAKRLEGLNTIKTVAKMLNISERTAINYIYELRKRGFAETKIGYGKIRIYRISPIKKKEFGYPSLYDVINKYSRINIVKQYEIRQYSHRLSIEETIVKAIETKEFRTILAMLDLFNKVKDWKKLKKFAEEKKLGRKVGALYDIARETIRVKRIDLRTRNALLISKLDNKYIVHPMKSKDFKEIEKVWRVYIPFGKADLRRYKE